VLDLIATRSPHDSVGVLTERARFALRREIPGSADPGRLVKLTDQFEEALSKRVTRFRGVGTLAMSEADLATFVGALGPHIDGHDEGDTTIVVRMQGLRPHVQELVRVHWADPRVLAEGELLDQWWDPAATVDVAPSGVVGRAG
jgi:flagellar biosynthesis component FlhA